MLSCHFTKLVFSVPLLFLQKSWQTWLLCLEVHPSTITRLCMTSFIQPSRAGRWGSWTGIGLAWSITVNVKQIRSDEIKRVEYLLVAPFRNCALFVLPFFCVFFVLAFLGSIFLLFPLLFHQIMISIVVFKRSCIHLCPVLLPSSFASFFSRVPSGYFHCNNGGLVFIRPLCTLRSFSLVLPLSLVLACALQVFASRPLFLPFSIILEILRSPGMILWAKYPYRFFDAHLYGVRGPKNDWFFFLFLFLRSPCSLTSSWP